MLKSNVSNYYSRRCGKGPFPTDILAGDLSGDGGGRFLPVLVSRALFIRCRNGLFPNEILAGDLFRISTSGAFSDRNNFGHPFLFCASVLGIGDLRRRPTSSQLGDFMLLYV